MTQPVLILNGPNLNLLGQREPEIYGAETLDDAIAQAQTEAPGTPVEHLQSNHEGVLIDRIHAARGTTAGIIINPGALTHTSIALLDALNAYDGPVVEVHISQVHKREAFRHHSYVSLRADAVIAGMGIAGYGAALRWIAAQA